MKKLIVLILMAMTGSVCMAQSNVVWRDSGPEYDSPKHLTFLGVEINGKESDLYRKLVGKGVKTKPNKYDPDIKDYYYKFNSDIENTTWGLVLNGKDNVAIVHLYMNEDDFNQNCKYFDQIQNWINANYPVEGINYWRYYDDEWATRCGIPYFVEANFRLKNGLGEINVKQEIRGHNDLNIEVDIIDAKNKANANYFKPSVYDTYDITNVMRDFGKCEMKINRVYDGIEFHYTMGGREYKIGTRLNDFGEIQKMLNEKDPKMTAIYVEVLRRYLKEAAKNCVIERVCYYSDNILPTVYAQLVADIEKGQQIAAQRSARQQNINPARSAMIEIMKHIAFPDKKSRDAFDRVVPQSIQNKALGAALGILGGGSGSYHSHGQTFSSEADMMQWEINNGYR